MEVARINNSEKSNETDSSLIGGRVSRRTFLKASMGVATAVLAGGPIIRSMRKIDPATVHAPTLRAPIYSKNGKSLVALVKCNDRVEGIRKAITLLGGLSPLIAGMNSYVLVKPNCNSSHPFPASTHPITLETTLKLLLDAGLPEKDIVVSDLPNAGALPTRTNFHQKGFLPILEQFGVSARFPDEEPDEEAYVRINAPAAKNWGERFTIMKSAYDASRIISLPILKTHMIGVFTMALKNSVGILSYSDRVRLHNGSGSSTRQKIAEINLAYSTDLVIVDGLEAFVDGGPTYGTKQKTKVIIAGSDRVAIDLVGASILKYYNATGLTENPVCHQDQIKRAKELGIGMTERDKISLLSENLTGDSMFEDLVNFVHNEME